MMNLNRGSAMLFASIFMLSLNAYGNDIITKPIRVSSNGHYLMQPDGAPFFWLGDTALQLFKHLDRKETDHYLKDRASKGFTVIQAVALGFYESKNREGELPLIDSDPARPNSRYFEHVDWVVDRAAHYGIRIAMLPVWGDHVTGGYGGRPKVFTTDNAYDYCHWIARRYRNKGVIWVLGGDTNPLWPNSLGFDQFGEGNREQVRSIVIDYRPIYDAMARGIIEGDGGDPLITYHPTSLSFAGTAQPRTSLYLGDRTWLDMNMLQTGHFETPVTQVMPQLVRAAGVNFGWRGTHNYEPIAQEFNSVPTRPVIDAESRWEDLPVNQQKGNRYWTADDSRNAAYHAVFAGAAGHNYGNENVANFYNPAVKPGQEMEWRPWREAIQSPVASQLRHLKALMLSRPYFTRIPDSGLIVGDLGEGERHIGATRDSDGSYGMVYLPFGEPVTIDLAKVSGANATAWWYDPRTGAAIRRGNYATKGQQRFVPPSSGRANDWVLVLDDELRGFPAPGTAP